ncbi:MYXO-CTERM sorting domain-containing protein [Bradymonas sediminis]|nr:MYXO-CTERM sorting domain-containing protein [Bradymonas sediminis]TDP75266.1 LPXTG-motif cell wall-anchored protein/uncharacterized protein (TIGR03382 family) [Bradymonas sediminis]
MMPTSTNRLGLPHWISPKFALFSVLIFLAACSTDSCSCDGFEQAEFPAAHYDKTLASGGQLRISQPGLEFMEGQVPNLIEQFQPGGLSFCIPRDTSGTPEICPTSTCTDGTEGCQLDLEIDDAALLPEPNDTLNVDITVGDIGGKDANGDRQDVIDVRLRFLGMRMTCDLVIYNKNGDESLPAQIQAQLPITFSVDNNSPTGDVRIDVGDIAMADFTDQVSYKLRGGAGCTIGGWIAPLFNGTINNMLQDQLGSIVDGLTNEQLCRACGADQPACPGNSTCGDNGGTDSCMYPSGECVPRTLGMEGNLKLGELIGSFSQNPTSEVAILAKLADMATVDTGLNLGLRIGAQPTEFGRCVPIDPTARPSFDAIPPSPELLADVTPNGDPFMLGIGVHKRALEHVLWSTWGGGALCMKLDSAQISQLSTDTLGLLLPSIKDLAGSGASTFLQIAPQTAPAITLGANTVTETADGYTIDEALMNLDWKDLDLHFYVYANDRYVRAFSLRTDLLLPIALASDGQGSIIPVLGDMENAVTNVRPMQTELLKEDPQVLIDLIPTLVGMALPSLAGSISQPIELPEVFGYRIAMEQKNITSIDNKTMLGIFAELVPVTQPLGIQFNSRILGHQLDLSQTTEAGVPRPVLTLNVMADLPDFMPADAAMDIEYSWRVNGGIWSLYQSSETLEIRDPMLVLQGKHRVEVRARFRGDHRSTEPVPSMVIVDVDYTAPTLEISRQNAIVNLLATDAIDTAEQLQFRHRIVSHELTSEWSAWGSTRAINLLEMDAPARFTLIAEARDRAGHVAQQEQEIAWDRRESALNSVDDTTTGTTPANESKSGGCSATGDQSPMGSLAGALALLGGLFFARRKRLSGRAASLMLAFLAVATLGLTGCDDDASQKNLVEGGDCDPVCTGDDICVDGTCQAPEEDACTSADDCGACENGGVAVCNDDGTCGCTEACPTELPDPCAQTTCDPGFEPSATSAGTMDPATCEVSGAVCDCVALPPLSLGVHGLYASVAERGEVRATAVYNKTYGDLMVATLSATGEPTWYFVDGLPETGPVTGALDGPRGGIATRGPKVGTHTAIGIDANDTLHVLYRDEDNSSLKYARGTKAGDAYTFETKTLNEDGDSGFYSSVLVADGVVHAVYSVTNFEDPTDGWQTQMRSINFAIDAPMDQLEPAADLVATAANHDPCGNSCVGTEVCVTSQTPAACVIKTRDCSATCDDGFACIDGTCETIFVSQAKEYPLMTGLFSQLSSTDTGIAVTFYDHINQQVGWAKRNDQTWDAAQFLGNTSGPYVSGAFDANGQLHLAYMDPVAQQLLYEQVGNGTPEVVADGARDTVNGYILADIGEDVDLRLLADGSVELLYQDATAHTLVLATRDPAGAWTSTTLSEPGSPYTGAHGFFATMVREPSTSSLAVDFVLNQQADPTVGQPEFHTLP